MRRLQAEPGKPEYFKYPLLLLQSAPVTNPFLVTSITATEKFLLSTNFIYQI